MDVSAIGKAVSDRWSIEKNFMMAGKFGRLDGSWYAMCGQASAAGICAVGVTRLWRSLGGNTQLSYLLTGPTDPGRIQAALHPMRIDVIKFPEKCREMYFFMICRMRGKSKNRAATGAAYFLCDLIYTGCK